MTSDSIYTYHLACTLRSIRIGDFDNCKKHLIKILFIIKRIYNPNKVNVNIPEQFELPGECLTIDFLRQGLKSRIPVQSQKSDNVRISPGSLFRILHSMANDSMTYDHIWFAMLGMTSPTIWNKERDDAICIYKTHRLTPYCTFFSILAETLGDLGLLLEALLCSIHAYRSSTTKSDFLKHRLVNVIMKQENPCPVHVDYLADIFYKEPLRIQAARIDSDYSAAIKGGTSILTDEYDARPSREHPHYDHNFYLLLHHRNLVPGIKAGQLNIDRWLELGLLELQLAQYELGAEILAMLLQAEKSFNNAVRILGEDCIS